MAAIFMKGKSNVFSLEVPPKTFYCPTPTRALESEFSMTNESKPTSNLSSVLQKTYATSTGARSSGTDSHGATNVSADRGDPKDSTLAKYIERFRQAKPTSREAREQDSHCFWWKQLNSNDPCTPPQPLGKESPVLQPSSSCSTQTPSTMPSLIGYGGKDGDQCEELIEKSEAILKNTSVHGNSCPAQHQHSRAQHLPPLAPHEDILYQWRLRRRLEQAQETVCNLYSHQYVYRHGDMTADRPGDPPVHRHGDVTADRPGDPPVHKPGHPFIYHHGDSQLRKQKDESQCHSNNLASPHTSPPTSCAGEHDSSVIAATLGGALGVLRTKAQYTAASEKPFLSKETSVTLCRCRSTGTQTSEGVPQGEEAFCAGSGSKQRPSVLYPDPSALCINTSESFLNYSVDLEQSLSADSAHSHPQECDVRQLLQTTPYSFVGSAGVVHISSSSPGSVGCIEDELLQLLIVRARLLEDHLKKIDSCLTSVQGCYT